MGEYRWVDVIFEGKQAYCGRCKKQGHNFQECRKRPPPGRSVAGPKEAKLSGTDVASQHPVEVADAQRSRRQDAVGDRTERRSHVAQQSVWKEVQRKGKAKMSVPGVGTQSVGTSSKAVPEARNSFAVLEEVPPDGHTEAGSQAAVDLETEACVVENQSEGQAKAGDAPEVDNSRALVLVNPTHSVSFAEEEPEVRSVAIASPFMMAMQNSLDGDCGIFGQSYSVQVETSLLKSLPTQYKPAMSKDDMDPVSDVSRAMVPCLDAEEEKRLYRLRKERDEVKRLTRRASQLSNSSTSR